MLQKNLKKEQKNLISNQEKKIIAERKILSDQSGAKANKTWSLIEAITPNYELVISHHFRNNKQKRQVKTYRLCNREDCSVF